MGADVEDVGGHGSASCMLIDEFLPRYDVVERHDTVVSSSAESTYAAIRAANLGAAIPVRALLALRALPAATSNGREGLGELGQLFSKRLTIADLERGHFHVLAENPPRELLIGLVGAFWTRRGGMCAIDAEEFRGPQKPGTARAAWNFAVTEIGDGRVRLSTETRVHAADARSRRLFRIYWLFVRPASGLIRRYMLRAIRGEAERSRAG